MGQKVNPHGLRVGIIKGWDSRWYAEGTEFADCLVEDYNIRKFLKRKLYNAGVADIEIERASDRVKVILYTAKPGVVIGKGGAEIEKVKNELEKLTKKKMVIDIKEVKRPDKDAQLVAENIAQQLENRVAFRRAMKSCMRRTMKNGAFKQRTESFALIRVLLFFEESLSRDDGLFIGISSRIGIRSCSSNPLKRSFSLRSVKYLQPRGVLKILFSIAF